MTEKQNTKKNFQNDVPADFVYCFNHVCPRCHDCLRYTMTQQLPDEPRIGLSVYPYTVADGKCPYFRRSQRIRFAWGLKSLFKNVLQKDSKPLHARLYALLGSDSAYSRYNTGKYLLTPEQQEEILQIFESFGYNRAELEFECYVEKYDFSTI